MARLFFTLYLTIIGAVFGIFFAIDYVTSKSYYDVEIEGITKSTKAYTGLSQVIYSIAGEKVMLESLHKALSEEDLILKEASGLPNSGLQKLVDKDTYVESKFGEDFTVYFKMLGKIYSVEPDKQSRRWQAERTLGNIYMAGFFFTIAFIIALWVYFLHRKLKVLELSAIKIANGDFTTRVPVHYKCRVGGLNTAFNKMAERIEQLIGSHQRLTNAVAHELRTPIFRLRCQAELLEYGIEETEHNQYIEGIEEDLSELDLLVAEMLSYARMELNEEIFVLENYELGDWLNDHRIILQRCCKKSLSLEIGEKIALQFDSRLLMRALSNLVRNADIHANNQIQIRYFTRDNYVVICVDDDGGGIPEADRSRIVEPFERLDDARTRNSGGHGLGLSIVRGIVQQHGGKIFISQSQLGGASVCLYLPLKV
ncbi:MAG: two-component system sensor histidine kinase RstB [Oceanospirillaceae bacterium]|jgi:two-component system sensor histidine kinase RstB